VADHADSFLDLADGVVIGTRPRAANGEDRWPTSNQEPMKAEVSRRKQRLDDLDGWNGRDLASSGW
jgi:hypothetical protein